VTAFNASRVLAIVETSVCPFVRHTLRLYHNGAAKITKSSLSGVTKTTVTKFVKFFSRNSSARSRAPNKRGLQKIGDFEPISRYISEMVRDKAKVTMNH